MLLFLCHYTKNVEASSLTPTFIIEPFSEEIVRQLEKAGDYQSLHPAGYPRVIRESEAFLGKPPFSASMLGHDIQRELHFWCIYLQLHGRPCPPQDEEQSPTISIIINRECE